MKTPEGRWLQKFVCWKVKLMAVKREKKSSTHDTSQRTSQGLDAIEEASSHADGLVDPASQDLHVFEESLCHQDSLDDLSAENPTYSHVLPDDSEVIVGSPLDNCDGIESPQASTEDIDASLPDHLEDTAVSFQIVETDLSSGLAKPPQKCQNLDCGYAEDSDEVGTVLEVGPNIHVVDSADTFYTADPLEPSD